MTSFKTLTDVVDTTTPLRVDLLADIKSDSAVRYYRTPANLLHVQTITVVSPTQPKSVIHVSASVGTVNHNGNSYTFAHQCDFAKASAVPEIVTSMMHLVSGEDQIPVNATPGHLALVPRLTDEIHHIMGFLGLRSLLGDTHKNAENHYDLDLTVTLHRSTYSDVPNVGKLNINEALHHHDFNDESEVVIAEADDSEKSKKDLHQFMQLLSQLGNGAAAAIPSTNPDSNDIIVKWKDVSLTMQKLHAATVAATPHCSAIRLTFTFPEKLAAQETVMISFTQTQHDAPLGETNIEHSSNVIATAGSSYDKDAIIHQQELEPGLEHTGVAVTKPHWYSPFVNAIAPALKKFEDAGSNFMHPLYEQARTAWHQAKTDVLDIVHKIATANI